MPRPDLEAIRARVAYERGMPALPDPCASNDVVTLLDYIAELEAIACDVAAVMGGPLDDARLHIETAREVNRHERPYSERLDRELVDALIRLRDLRAQARALNIPPTP